MTNAPSTPLSARSMAAALFQSPSTSSTPWSVLVLNGLYSRVGLVYRPERLHRKEAVFCNQERKREPA
jgi:hypothetical protein